MQILVHLAIHFFTSLSVGGVLYYLYHNFWLIIFSLISGFWLDIDHFIDYFYWAGLRFNLKEFLDTSLYVDSTKKVFVIFHGWEYLPILFWVGTSYEKEVGGLTIALVLPYLFHMFMDQILSKGSLFSYSFLYRLWHRFSLKNFLD